MNKSIKTLFLILILFSCGGFDGANLKQSFNENPQKYTHFVTEIKGCYYALDSLYKHKMADGGFLITSKNFPSDILFNEKLLKQLKYKEMEIKCLSKNHIEFRYFEEGNFSWKALYFVNTIKSKAELISIYNTHYSHIETIEKKEGNWYTVEVIQSI